ncbi:hypothetical protein [Massilia sp. Mn16-1_5]|uniref:hypothetical protein n=1 Tax=Massilia sp. Mn16-1_5 TaxID=2079199 RepID=UPI00109E5608|nr:hypothetical protein [Massilia sp. Mn16-1_5]THC43191.1 hypothetical protein C2862_13160 [Massilia sp. Mn16-1_5]
MNRWHFEAIDLRAGLAIAVRRPPRTAATELVCNENPCLFFAPPGFQPEAIGNLAVAMAASRGSFQASLYVGETEVSFATPEEVAEFVRRAYVGGAGGDGGDGGGGDGPIPPLPDRPRNLEPIRIEGFDGPVELAAEVHRFQTAVTRTKHGESTEFEWNLSQGMQGEAMSLLVHGVLALYRELLDRWPGKEGGYLRWIDDARALGQAVIRIQLLPVLLSVPYFNHFRSILEHSKLYSDGTAHPFHRFMEMIELLFGPDYVFDELPGSELHFPRWHRRLYETAAYASPPAWNILDILEKLPVPEPVEAIFPADVGKVSSVYHLLNVFVSDPRAALASNIDMTAVLGISLFAAACICTAGTPVLQELVPYFADLYHEYPDDVKPMSISAPGRAQMVVEKSRRWLAEHLPRLAYSPPYEDLIVQSKSQRYRLVG